MAVHTKLSTFFRFLIAFSTFVVISFTMRDVELKMVYNGLPVSTRSLYIPLPR
ncbi:predicted protein [Arabidopsis lyrata subsp. lyrata]|uniref:Predicted protein n=1 Tax=Arabidopsis lyrata subsp. lyrata TaxID=81972 RepID=D7KMG4_ARALL|nr:predicted protein [Arabidopsis lyrata subsp. lyrata]